MPFSLPSSITKRLGAWLIDDLDLLLLGVLQLPGRRLEEARAAGGP